MQQASMPGKALQASEHTHHTPTNDALWVLGSLCALHQRNFDAAMVLHEFPPPCDDAWLQRTAQALGFRIREAAIKGRDCAGLPLPVRIMLKAHDTVGIALITAANAHNVVIFMPGKAEPQTLTHTELDARLSGKAWLFAPEPSTSPAPDGLPAQGGIQGNMPFGFKWFVPELLRHRSVWRDVLLASLALQLVTLATPLFTQAIIDKVVVHRTHSTLAAIGLAMGILVIFSALLGWGRQYLVLHTGNRVDAVLGAAVWAHLLRLPLRYFEHRPSGVIAARLHAVENIREFVSGAAVSLVLDLPFLLIALGLMLYYSTLLSAISVGRPT